MISSRVELVSRRRLVNAFIKADYAMVAFVRPGEITKTDAGGKVRGTPTELEEQQVAIIQSKRRYDSALVNAEAGSIPETEYLILGRHTLDVQENDTFTWMGKVYTVLAIHPTRTESTLCAIEFQGGHNG